MDVERQKLIFGSIVPDLERTTNYGALLVQYRPLSYRSNEVHYPVEI